MSMRLGISMIFLILAKFLRSRGLLAIEYANKENSQGRWATLAPVQRKGRILLDFGFGAGFNQLLLGLFGLFLGNAGLEGLGSTVDQVLGFFETQAGES